VTVHPAGSYIRVRRVTETVTPGGIHVPASAVRYDTMDWRGTVEAHGWKVQTDGLHKMFPIGCVVLFKAHHVLDLGDGLGLVDAEHIIGTVEE
jgi:hypothetical protein